MSPGWSENWWRMILRQQLRVAVSLVLVIGLALWVGTCPAIIVFVGEHGPQCHARSSQTRHATASGHHAMASDCCPRHATKPGLSSHLAAALAPFEHPDCCALSPRPERPSAFLITSGASAHVARNALASGLTELVCQLGGRLPTESPPFSKSVLDRKTDFRI